MTAQEAHEAVRLILRVGTLLCTAGSAAFRARRAMQRLAKALGADRCELLLSANWIALSATFGGHSFTEVAPLPVLGVDMNRLCRIEILTRHPKHLTPSMLHAELDELVTAPRLYPRWTTVVGLGVACAAFCGAGGGDLVQLLAAFLGAALGHALRLYLGHGRHLLASIVVSSSFLSSAVSATTVRLLHPDFSTRGRELVLLAVVASVLYLIPGVPLVTSLIDLVHLETSASVTRAAYAGLVVGSLVTGVFGFLALAQALSGGGL